MGGGKTGKGQTRSKVALLHPNDRKVRQMEKKGKREARLASQKDKLKSEKSQLLLRFFWFREQCIALGYKGGVPSREVLLLVLIYTDRHQDELRELRSLRNPPAGRIKQLEAIRAAELEAFQSRKGFAIPSLADADDVEILTEIWDGEADTVVVVPSVNVSHSQWKESPSTSEVADFASRLKHIDDVREQAAPILPAKSIRFRAASRTTSVKKVERGVENVKIRGAQKERAKQSTRVRQSRANLLAEMRNDD